MSSRFSVSSATQPTAELALSGDHSTPLPTADTDRPASSMWAAHQLSRSLAGSPGVDASRWVTMRTESPSLPGGEVSGYASRPTTITVDPDAVGGARVHTPQLLFSHKRLYQHLHGNARKTPTLAERRHRVMSVTPTLRLTDVDGTINAALIAKKRLAALDAPTPAAIEAMLNEDLAAIAAEDKYRRLHAHRLAFEKFLTLQSDPTTQNLLRRILTCYEEIELHQFSQEYETVTQRLHASEEVARDAINERNALRHHAESLRLDIINLERQLQTRDEVLSELASTHKINLSGINWAFGAAGGGAASSGGAGLFHPPTAQTHASSSSAGQRTMAEIRTIQDRVAVRQGEAARRDTRDEHKYSLKQEEEEQQTALIDATSASLDRGLHALHGVTAHELGILAGGQPTLSTATIQDTYIHAQRVDNVGCNLERSGHLMLPAAAATTHSGQGSMPKSPLT